MLPDGQRAEDLHIALLNCTSEAVTNVRSPSAPRLTPTEAEILSLLVGAERYGLELVEASEGRVKRGSVYVLLGRMEEKRLVSSRPEARPAAEGGIPRRLYRPTAAGLGALARWEERMLTVLGRTARS